jgi:hypothetical protein
MKIDLHKLKVTMWKQDPDKFIHLFGYPCKCKDTLSAMIAGSPICVKCGKMQVN